MRHTENNKNGLNQAEMKMYELIKQTGMDCLKSTLKDMFYSFLYSEYSDDQNYRSQTTFHYKIIYEYFDDLKGYENDDQFMEKGRQTALKKYKD